VHERSSPRTAEDRLAGPSERGPHPGPFSFLEKDDENQTYTYGYMHEYKKNFHENTSFLAYSSELPADDQL